MSIPIYSDVQIYGSAIAEQSLQAKKGATIDNLLTINRLESSNLDLTSPYVEDEVDIHWITEAGKDDIIQGTVFGITIKVYLVQHQDRSQEYSLWIQIDNPHENDYTLKNLSFRFAAANYDRGKDAWTTSYIWTGTISGYQSSYKKQILERIDAVNNPSELLVDVLHEFQAKLNVKHNTLATAQHSDIKISSRNIVGNNIELLETAIVYNIVTLYSGATAFSTSHHYPRKILGVFVDGVSYNVVNEVGATIYESSTGYGQLQFNSVPASYNGRQAYVYYETITSGVNLTSYSLEVYENGKHIVKRWSEL